MSEPSLRGPIPRPDLVKDKIQARHRDRLAVVYVRQSTVQQVEHHQESTRLQYALVERALHLGWSRDQVLLIDEDLGRSGASAEGRPGFQRLVAEVGLGHVGLVLGIEVSRLARSCRDWHQLLEMCALFDTLIADSDGVYDPTAYNDRLLLGLKGTLSEAELHVLKARMQEGRRSKAQRGELVSLVPRGYVCRPSGEVVLDPDEQVQAIVRLVFDLFERHGTIHSVLTYLVAHDIRLPNRVWSGPLKGELEWRRPNRQTLRDMLHNPAYAGAYAYGRRAVDPRCKRPGRPGTGRTVRSPDGWSVLIKERWPAYISWEVYQRNQDQIMANQSRYAGVPRGGAALLAGLVVCGRCGSRMAACYRHNGHDLAYSCSRQQAEYGQAFCQSFNGRALDAHVTGLLLQALTPSALDVSLQVAEDLELERAELHRQWQQRLERAHYDVDRAQRHYKAVDPENRLVARTLERQWEEALAAEVRLKVDFERFLARQPAHLSAQERDAIRRLAEEVPALWTAPTTTAADRQAIARLVLERVVVTVQGDSETVEAEVHWAGGGRTRTEFTRPVARLDQLTTHRELLARVAALHADGHTPAAIAATLNAEGWRPPKRRETFTAPMVCSLLHRQGLAVTTRRRPTTQVERCSAHEWTIQELAVRLDVPQPTLQSWVYKGVVKARIARVGCRRIWMVEADDAEINRLCALRCHGQAERRGAPIAADPKSSQDSSEAP